MVRLAIIGLLCAAAAVGSGYERDRAAREAELRGKESPLTLVERRTVRRGSTELKAPDIVGIIAWDGKKAVFTPKGSGAPIEVVTAEGKDERRQLTKGTVNVWLHWAEKTGELFLRVYDESAPVRAKVVPRVWFPPSGDWRIEADWKPQSPPRNYTVNRADGTKTEYAVAGTASFEVKGQRVAMIALRLPDGRLFLPFKDKTAPKETYGAGRFLYANAPAGGKVTLDFNLANNPNCAFSPYWSCVLPPKENVLTVRVEAGEKNWPGLDH
jgi:uncharacterized protein (DUF1684 family)